MPFESKAQQRFMFAAHPRIAKRWAGETKDIKKLPEKKAPSKEAAMTKKASGMFFEKMARPQNGRYFRDLKGRDDATFHQKSAMDGSINVSPPGTESMSTGTTGAPIGGQGFRSDGMSSAGGGAGGGMYGSGQGLKKKKKTATKTAGTSPSDWNADSGIPTGFHRPAAEQPEALEAGGERFHDTTQANAGGDFAHGVSEGGTMRLRQGSGSQQGKHASAAPARFLGTSLGIGKHAAYDAKDAEGYAKDVGGKFKESLKTLGREGAETADKAVRGIAGSPVAAGIAALVAARMGLKGAKGLASGAARMAGVKRRVPQSLAGRAVGSFKKLLS